MLDEVKTGLTGWEGGKIGAGLALKICKAGEEHEAANPGVPFKPTMAQITAWAVETVTELGIEIAD